MKQILSLLPRPSHYLGIEEGAVCKDPHTVALHCALAFPDLYEVGMSYLGQKILYSMLNARPDCFAERVFAPCAEAGALLKQHQVPLATLESDTPLHLTDMVGFSITHELCFTNVLYMLDLAGIPLYASQRGDALPRTVAGLDSTVQADAQALQADAQALQADAQSPQGWPLIVAGGGCTVAAEPLAPFMDLMLLGEGEALLAEVGDLLIEAKTQGWSRSRFLSAAAHIPGVYVPAFFSTTGPTALPRPGRRIVADIDQAPYPVEQVVPFGAVHNRLSLEIARGCTRGCRFCQAGMIYRPARERSLPVLQDILTRCLDGTGFDEVSFLSLSTGDFSALKTLFLNATDRCASEQISLSLPSLRVGSIDDAIMERMAGIRRTGATLAPEAGSQRLRDVINKGISEDDLMLHVRKLFEHGWQQIKLYFMIGLPSETDADMDAIVDLCRKVRDAAGRGMPRLQVTAAISPFVPKAHTPFQWEAQLSREQINQRIIRLREAFRTEKNLKLRWHDPATSALEGILSRGDRLLAPVVEAAFRKGAIFCSWTEHFALEPWLEALAEAGLTVERYTGPRNPEEPLPWDHLEAGVSKAFLLKERERALTGIITDDCRYAACRQCGACDTKAGPSLLPHAPGKPHGSGDVTHANKLNFPQRDQQDHLPTLDENGRIVVRAPRSTGKPTAPPIIAADLAVKAVRYRVWHTKEGEASFISQLELQSLLERAMRRAGLPLAFSQGFHPLPLISFGRALPVGVESLAEWFSVTLRQPMRPDQLVSRLTPCMLRGMRLDRVELIPINDKSLGSVEETFVLRYLGPTHKREEFNQTWERFVASESHILTRETKKGPRTADIRPLFHSIEWDEQAVMLTMDWATGYISPQTMARAITPWVSIHEIKLVKLAQVM